MSLQYIADRVASYKIHTGNALFGIYEATMGDEFQAPSRSKHNSPQRSNAARGGERYLMSIAELDERINLVIRTPITLPYSVSMSLQNAVDLRDEVTELLGKHKNLDSGSPQDEGANQRHVWFSDHLRDVHSRLEEAGVFAVPDLRHRVAAVEAYAGGATHMHNSYSVLSLDEPAMAQEEATTNPRLQFEIEESPEETKGGTELADRLIRTINDFEGFKQELHTMREQCRADWRKVRDKKLDMCAAGVVANTAICFARDHEERINESLNSFGGMSAFWDTYHAPLSSQIPPTDDTVLDGERWTVVHDYDRFLDNGYAIIHHYRVLNATSALGKDDGGITYLIPHEKKLQYVSRDTGIPAKLRYEQDQKWLVALHKEMLLFAECSLHSQHVTGGFVVDELLHHYIQLLENRDGRWPTWVLYAAQIYLDIAHIFGKDIKDPFNELFSYSEAVSSQIQDLWGLSRRCAGEVTLPDSDTPIEYQLRHVLQDRSLRYKRIPLNSSCLRPLIWRRISWRRRFNARFSRGRHSRPRGETCRCLSPVHFRLLKVHPILCALLLWHVRYRQQELGVRLSNANPFITLAISACDFLIRTGCSHVEPNDFTILRRLHGDHSFFSGGEPAELHNPVTQQAQLRCYQRKLWTALGLVLGNKTGTNFSNTGTIGSGWNILLPSSNQRMRELAPIYFMFKNQFAVLIDDRRSAWTPSVIMNGLEDSKWVPSTTEDGTIVMTPKVNKKVAGKGARVKKRPSTARALRCLGNSLHAEAWEVSIPYLGVLSGCQGLLEQWRLKADSVWHKWYGENVFEDSPISRMLLPGTFTHLWARDDEFKRQSRFFEEIGDTVDRWASGTDSKKCGGMWNDERMGFISNSALAPLLRDGMRVGDGNGYPPDWEPMEE